MLLGCLARPGASVLVSVIVPTYNRAAQVVGALSSVLAQTHRDLEVIVVDDGSTDGTGDMVARRYGAEPRVLYVHQENAGVASARNAGLERARGELIAFLDSDDAWRPWKLALQLACLQRAPAAGMIWTDMEAVDASGNVIPGSSLRDILTFRFTLEELFTEHIPLAELPGTPDDLRDRNLHVGDIFGKMVIGNLVLPSSALMTRARLDLVARFDESIRVGGEDFDFFLRTCREGSVAFIDVPSVLYAVGREDQLTHPSKALHLARNYLRTMDDAIARDPERISLPPATVAAARAYAHSWTARSYLEAGNSRAARAHLRQALRLRPTDKRTLALAVLALAPGALCARAFRLLRRLKQAIRRPRSRPPIAAR
jgi:glycosyltransferase involved in cell wall biosynthesis